VGLSLGALRILFLVLAAIAMRHFTLLMLSLLILACSPKKQESKRVAKSKFANYYSLTDSCFRALHIDSYSSETITFQKLWENAERSGYTFSDETTNPFVKVIFQPKSSAYYNDSLKITNCEIFDSVNIHKSEIRSSKTIDKIYYPNLIVEEWNFKSSTAAREYANALSYFFSNGYGVKSPTSVVLTDSSVYIFQTAAYMFIAEMEKMERNLAPNAIKYATNY
jgi:hypothetical protein